MFDAFTTINEQALLLTRQLILFLTEDTFGRFVFAFLILVAYGYAFKFWQKLTVLETDAIDQTTKYEKYLNSDSERLLALQTKLLATISLSLRLIAGLVLFGLAIWFFGVVQ